MMRQNIEAADLFCGAGGTSTGMLKAASELKLGINLLAINHWPVAINTHSLNHKNVRHKCETLDTIKPREAVPGGRLGLLAASPECFPAGTLILTSVGLTPIEMVRPGDLVLTHTGRYCQVTRCMQSIRDTVVVRGHGHYGLESTPNHPFYSRTRKKHFPKTKRSGEWRWSQPEWRNAENMNGAFWGTPTKFPKLPFECPPFLLNEEAFWLLGRWVGDGCIDCREKRGGTVEITCGFHEVGELGQKLSGWDNEWDRKWSKRSTRTAAVFSTHDTVLARWLTHNFGRLAGGKSIPSWMLGLDEFLRRAFLDGYMSADGHFNGRKHEATTISKSLAFGLRMLAESLGFRAALHKCAQHCNEIEGRTFKTHDIYRPMWVANRKRNYSEELEGVAWSRIRSVMPGRAAQTVYNLSVAHDESYVADGVIVHNCTHHSVAAGGRPKNDQSRATAWHVCRWASDLTIDSIFIENVKEFQDWGPLGANGKPIKSRKGETFKAFINALTSMGYRVEYRIQNAAAFGDPTSRKRLIIMARRNGLPIPWPDHSHGPGLKPFRTARQIIDWDIPGKSIFGRKKPLSPNTMRRIAAGLRKFGGAAAEPFLVMMYGTNKARSVDMPCPTVTAGGNHIALAQPFILPHPRPKGDGPVSVDKPLNTITATSCDLSLVQPFLVPYHSGKGREDERAHSIDEPMRTQDTQNRHALVQPFLVNMKGQSNASDIDSPIPTITAHAPHIGVCEPFLMHMRHTGADASRCHSTDKPVPTVTGARRGEIALIEPFVLGQQSGAVARSVENPLPTVATDGAIALVQPFVLKYYKTGITKSVDLPLDTISTKDRFLLVEPVTGQPVAELDIRLRMLQPHELAAAMSFPDDYKFYGTREQAVKQIGNAVPVELARAHCQSLLASLL